MDEMLSNMQIQLEDMLAAAEEECCSTTQEIININIHLQGMFRDMARECT